MRIWDKILILIAWVVLVICCSTSNMTREEKLAQQAKIVQMVNDSLENRTFTIDVNYVTPNRMRAHHLGYGYYIRMNKDSIDAYIPFFGVAYRADFGTNDEGLKYKGPISGCEVLQIKKHIKQINVLVKKPMDEILYQIDVYDTGRASIFVRSLNRESIHFDGDMIIKE